MTTNSTGQAAVDASAAAPTDRYDAARFKADTPDHQMTVLHEDGLYRHLRFAKPGTGMYRFDLITWPGHLSVVGDFGPGYVFARERDMFEFFRANRYGINPHYWAEKIVTGSYSVKKYSQETFKQYVDEHVTYAIEQHAGLTDLDDDRPGLVQAVKDALSDEYNHEYEETAREFLRDFEYRYIDEAGKPATFQFTDTWEWDFSDWGWSYLWACHAIQWGIGQYDTWVAAGRPAPELAPAKATVELSGGAA